MNITILIKKLLTKSKQLRAKIFYVVIILLVITTLSISLIISLIFTSTITKDTNIFKTDMINLLQNLIDCNGDIIASNILSSYTPQQFTDLINLSSVQTGLKERDLDNSFNKLCTELDFVECAYIMDLRQNIYTTTANETSTNTLDSLNYKEFFINNFDYIKELYSKPFWTKFNLESDLIFCVLPIYKDYIFGYQGMVAVGFNKDVLLSLYQNNESEYIYIYNYLKEPLVTPKKNLSDFVQNNNTTNNNYPIKQYDGNSYFLINSTDKNTNFSIAYCISTNELYKNIDIANSYVWTTFTIIMVIASIICFFMITNLTKKLNFIKNQIHQIQSGNLNTPYLTGSEDEFYYISKRIHNMANELQSLNIQILDAEKQKQKLRYSALKSEYNQLQAQINPHFTYNVLESINAIAKQTQNFQISNITQMFAKQLRFSINTKKDYVPLKLELEIVNNYIELNHYLYSKNVTVYFDISEETKDILVPKLIIQPIVENAILHGFKENSEENIIIISSMLYNDQLEITISDSGCGINADKISELVSNSEDENSTHIGIQNVSKRLDLFCNDTKKHLIVNSEYGCGTIVKLIITHIIY